MKNIHQIDAILDKYWEGESSLEEERVLQSYFRSGNVAAHHLPFAPMFQAFREDQELEMAPPRIAPMRNYRLYAAAAAVLLLICASIWWMQPDPVLVKQPVAHTEKPVTTPNTQPVEQQANIEPEKTQPAIAIAASPTKPKFKLKRKKHTEPAAVATAEPSPEEAELAREEIKAALALLSSKLGKGRSKAAKGLNEVEHLDILKPRPGEG
ncbi:MAG: hypothetical protein R2792_02990 [Saprospiraceae bacterium]